MIGSMRKQTSVIDNERIFYGQTNADLRIVADGRLVQHGQINGDVIIERGFGDMSTAMCAPMKAATSALLRASCYLAAALIATSRRVAPARLSPRAKRSACGLAQRCGA
jgi:hypothetical protein